MFVAPVDLKVEGFGGRPVVHQFLRQAEETRDLVIFLPGMGYNCDMPIFYYTQNLIEARGSDLMRVDYDYGRVPEFRSRGWEDQKRWLFADAVEAFRAARKQRDYERITFIGKSLGTLAIGHIVASQPQEDASFQTVWLTPVLRDAVLSSQMRDFPGRSLLVIGTADPGFGSENLDELVLTEAMSTVVIQGADHGLDVPGDVSGSIDCVAEVLRAIHEFLDE